MKTTKDIGFEKEKEVVEHLKKLKYEVIETNFSTKFGEIDIIAKHKDAIVFIEVKYRKSLYSGVPQEAVTFKKQQKIIKSAITYVKQNNIKNDIRFDVAATDDNKVEIIESAFTSSDHSYYF